MSLYLQFIHIFFGKTLAFPVQICYNTIALMIWPVGQAAKTSPSHGENMGSIPVRVTIAEKVEPVLKEPVRLF